MENPPDNEKETKPQGESLKSAEPVEDEIEEAQEEPRRKGIAAVFREAFDRARHGPRRGSAPRPNTNLLASDRTVRNRDRTKTLFVSVVGLVAVLVIFLGVFSSSHSTTKREPAAKRNPSLGRPEDQGRRAGSVAPLLSAEMNGQDPEDGQLTPEDINNTSRPRGSAEAAPTEQKVQTSRTRAARRGAGADFGQTLNDVQFTDPALEAYRQRMTASPAAPPSAAPPTAPAQAAAPVLSESDTLGKASLVYVRANPNGGTLPVNGAQLLPAAATIEPAFLNSKVWSGLPAGTRLVARLQTAVSTAVKAPVVAVIETHYERDGEIVLPAGTKAFGELESGTHSGFVGIRFHTLQMPDGTTQKIEAGAMSLNFEPLKGQVSGRNRGKQFLARAVTGVGTVAAFAVGHPGGLTGSMDNSILLRDRISQNLGMAGEQEVMNLAYSQEIVVTVPGNTRFFIVLQQGTGPEGAKPELLPAGSRSRSNLAVASNGERPELPTAAELRELVSLKQELNRMYREVAATRTSPDGAPVR
jgi:Bacterial conjugation TrbI-like protein